MAEEEQWKLEDVQQTGLLHSGASHPLRPGSARELQQCTKVMMTLAGDDTTMLSQNEMGTIVVPPEKAPQVQPIVPLGALIQDLGCSLTWTRSHLKLTHPRPGRLRVSMKGKCPEVAIADALRLIRELEEVQLSQLTEQVDDLSARLQMIEGVESQTWDENLREFVRTGRKDLLWKVLMAAPYTKDLPEEVKELMAEGFNLEGGKEYLKALPLSRRDRRRLLASTSWVVHLYAGAESEKDDPFRVLNKNGKVLLEIDVVNSRLWNMNLVGGAYRMLLWAAASGRVEDVLGGPPCRTFSALLHRPKEGYPQPARSPAHLYGLPGLDERRRNQVNRDTALIAKQLLLWNVAFVARGGDFVGFLVEHPGDPNGYRQECGDVPIYPSLWLTGMWREFERTFGMTRVDFDQGALGHHAVKPTSCGTNYAALKIMQGLKADRKEKVPATTLPADILARWAQGFRRRIVEAILGPQVAPVPPAVGLNVLAKMSAEQREMWKKHLEADHQPYRADCAVCINAQATGKPHRKVMRRSGFTLAVDLAGPFKHKGRDMDNKDYKYLMVAAYRFPKTPPHVTKPKEYEELLEVPGGAEDGTEEDDLHLDDLFEPGGEVCGFEGEGRDRELEADDEEEPKLHVEEPANDQPPEEGEVKFGPTTMEEALEDLTKPVEVTTVYLSRPLWRRTGAAVLTAIQELCIQLDRQDLPVYNIHTDRAREFGTAQLKAWLANQQITRTTTSGAEPAGNATAERGVRWYKARARALLKAANASPSDWPMAAAHASAMLWKRAFPSSTLFKGKVAAFGQVVWYKAKTYKGVKEKEIDTVINKNLPARWKRATYRGPSMDVTEGHLLLREDGGLTLAKGLKDGVKEPENESPPLLPELEIDEVEDPGPPVPRSRLREKTAVKMLALDTEL